MTEQEQERAREEFIKSLEGKSIEDLTYYADELVGDARMEKIDEWSLYLNAYHKHMIVMRVIRDLFSKRYSKRKAR